MSRQVKDYTNLLYIPTAKRSATLNADEYRKARELAHWKESVREAWPRVHVTVDGPRDVQFPIGADLSVVAHVDPGGLRAEDLLVELVAGRDQNGGVEELAAVPLEPVASAGTELRYEGGIEVEHGGSIVYGVRVLPASLALVNKFDFGLVLWA